MNKRNSLFKKVSPIIASSALLLSATSGATEITPNIVGGQPADTSQWQFYTQILNSNGSTAFCGGSYIGDGYVLTAAHCVKNKATRFLHVKVAGFVLGGNDGDRIQVAEKFVHPQYNSNTLNHDVALLKLERTPTLGRQVALAQSNINQYVRNGDFITVAGLGRLSEGGSRPSNLQEVSVPLVSDQVCNQSGGSYANVGDVAFCAGFAQGQKDSCSGDSGGPIVVNSGGQTVQLGIVSWGVGCARPAKYGVYADVAALGSWIDSVKGGAQPISVSYTQSQTLPNFKLGEQVAHTYTVKNTGTSAFTFASVALENSGVASTPVKSIDSCSASTLQANQSCQVNVEFTATAPGTANVALQFKLDGSQTTYSAKITALATSSDSSCKGTWNASSVYDKPDQVTYYGKVYEALWWTQGDIPADSGKWGVWQEIGVDSSCKQ